MWEVNIALKSLLSLKKVNEQDNKEVTMKIKRILGPLLCFISCCLRVYLFFHIDCLANTEVWRLLATEMQKKRCRSRAAKGRYQKLLQIER